MNALIPIKNLVAKPNIPLILSAFCLGLIFVIFYVLILKTHSQNDLILETLTTRTTPQLIQIDKTLNQLTAQSANSQVAVNTLASIQQQLKSVQTQLAALKGNVGQSALQQQIETQYQTLSAQLDKIQKQTNIVTQHQRFTQKLSAAHLPFKVVNVDVWNGNLEVTINANHVTTLIGEGDNFAGWTLTKLSFEPALAVFKNAQGQTVHVTLH